MTRVIRTALSSCRWRLRMKSGVKQWYFSEQMSLFRNNASGAITCMNVSKWLNTISRAKVLSKHTWILGQIQQKFFLCILQDQHSISTQKLQQLLLKLSWDLWESNWSHSSCHGYRVLCSPPWGAGLPLGSAWYKKHRIYQRMLSVETLYSHTAQPAATQVGGKAVLTVCSKE